MRVDNFTRLFLFSLRTEWRMPRIEEARAIANLKEIFTSLIA